MKVHASSVNRADLDWLLPKGGWFLRLFLGFRRPRRQTLGIDVAGTVEAVGPEANRFKVGDRVFGDLIMGGGMAAFAEFAAAPERRLQLMPGELSFEEAATLPHSGALAIMGLRPHWGQELQAGDSVMVVGASGNVGPFAVQIAKARGLRVTGVCRTAKVDFVRSLGADEVIDYTTTDYTRAGERYDWIVDTDSHHSLLAVCRALVRGGVYVTLGGTSWPILASMLAAPFVSMAVGRRMGLLLWWKPFNAPDVQRVTDLVAAGKV
ncbi:MAG TPA: NAD(P)-dependent alcohol dehydrogenase, partial [Candidatus Acidoferrales bacterium]|nr:NAD(P)-dependent alcohol dehydrogenase [Candidatus Acidoferrales bacterium]